MWLAGSGIKAGLNLGKTLYSFSGGYTNGPDGAFALGSLVADTAGNYYGVTSGGGGSTTTPRVRPGVSSWIIASSASR